MMLQREPCSACVVERSVTALLGKKIIRRVAAAPELERPAYAIYPDIPTHPDVQATALRGLRELAASKN